MNTTARTLSIFLIPLLITYSFLCLCAPLLAYAGDRITPYAPDSAESLAIEEPKSPAQPPDAKSSSSWWKWALGIAVVGGIAAAAGGGGSGDGGGGSSSNGGATVTGSW